MKTKFLFLLLLASHTIMHAQDLEKHQWEERIIVVTSPTFGNTQATQQLEALKKDFAALKERKLVVYHVTNTGYRVDFVEGITLQKTHEATISDFEVTLIGLDGGTKFESPEAQKAAVFFRLIDSMPMRRAEIKNKNYE